MPSLRHATLAFKVEIDDGRGNEEEYLMWDDWEGIYESLEATSNRIWKVKLEAGDLWLTAEQRYHGSVATRWRG